MGQKQQIRNVVKKTRNRRDQRANEGLDHDFKKMQKSLVRYRNASPEDVENETICGSCRFFDRDDAYCHLVEGEINAEDVCDFWAPTEVRVTENSTIHEGSNKQ